MRILLLPLLLVFACSEDRVDLPLTWSFADGRLCDDAGVARIELALSGRKDDRPVARCHAGSEGSQVMVTQIAVGTEIDAVARSAPGTALYRGHAALGRPLPPGLHIVFYFTGGR